MNSAAHPLSNPVPPVRVAASLRAMDADARSLEQLARRGDSSDEPLATGQGVVEAERIEYGALQHPSHGRDVTEPGDVVGTGDGPLALPYEATELVRQIREAATR